MAVTATQDSAATRGTVSVYRARAVQGWTVLVNDAEVSFFDLQGTAYLEDVGNAEFKVLATSGATTVAPGDRVEVISGTGRTMLKGWVINVEDTTPDDNLQGDRFVRCQCSDRGHVVGTRLVWLLAQNQRSGTIVENLIAHLDARAPTHLTVVAERGVYLNLEVTFDGVPLATALDWLVAQNPDYVWWIERDRLLFQPRTYRDAPFDITDSVRGYGERYRPKQMGQYRNVQYVVGSNYGLTGEAKEEWSPGTGQTTLALSRPVARVLVVNKDGTPQTVGVEGLPADYGDTVTVERGRNVINVPGGTGAAESWDATFVAYRRVMGYAQGPAADLARYGRRESLYINEDVPSDADADRIAVALLDRYAGFTQYDYQYSEARYGAMLAPGDVQQVTLTDWSLDAAFIVEQVRYAVLDTQESALVEVHTTRGRPRGSEEAFVRALLTRDAETGDTEGDLLDVLMPLPEETESVTTGAAYLATPITFVDENNALTTAGTSVTVTKPTGLAEDDVMIAVVVARASTTITPPSGWTSLHKITEGGQFVLETFWKRAGASEGASYQFDSSATTDLRCCIAAYRGVSTVTAINADAATQGNSTSPATDATLIATAYGQAVLACGGRQQRTFDTSPTFTSRYQEDTVRPILEIGDRANKRREPGAADSWSLSSTAIEWGTALVLLQSAQS